MRLSECCGRKQQADRRATLERQMMFDATATAMEKLFDPRATWSVWRKGRELARLYLVGDDVLPIRKEVDTA
jgi:hypothetical protein